MILFSNFFRLGIAWLKNLPDLCYKHYIFILFFCRPWPSWPSSSPSSQGRLWIYRSASKTWSCSASRTLSFKCDDHKKGQKNCRNKIRCKTEMDCTTTAGESLKKFVGKVHSILEQWFFCAIFTWHNFGVLSQADLSWKYP